MVRIRLGFWLSFGCGAFLVTVLGVSSRIQSPRADLQEGFGRSLCGQDSALILALLRVLRVSRDRSKRFLEDSEPRADLQEGFGRSL